MDIIELAEQNQQNAWKLLDETGIIPAWERIGATVHLVGSLKSGLLMKSRDIDLHIYTGKLDITESFSVMQELAERLKLKEIQYKNLVHTEEECIEWHVLYEDQELHTWKFDLIHIRKGSKYDGVVENVTAAIAKLLTPGLRETILRMQNVRQQYVNVISRHQVVQKDRKGKAYSAKRSLINYTSVSIP